LFLTISIFTCPQSYLFIFLIYNVVSKLKRRKNES